MAMMTAGYALIFTADLERTREAVLMKEQAKAVLPVVELGQPPKDLGEPGARECIVCMSRPISTASFPCQHSVLCDHCMRKVRRRNCRCPLCRSEIDVIFRGVFEDEVAELPVAKAEAAIHKHEQSAKKKHHKKKSVCGTWPQTLRWAMQLCSPPSHAAVEA
mmetsp:Transcript_71040/g.205979  ORF Transcript_71040/g.205979 Transcript_71040/m.205979 type:complete len:162 (-) Transcript_71040:110-595(-)